MRDIPALCAALIASAAAWAATTGATAPTYSREIARILNNRCVECHRAGEVAPMALTSYKEVRPWAKAIREQVATRSMPPWLADPAYGAFKNDRRLTQQEIDAISAWVAAGAPEGDPKDLPPPPQFESGWNIGKPDQVFDIGVDFDVPAQGVVPYKYFRVPTNFSEDKWVQAAEIRPDQRRAIHHIIVFIEEPGKKGGVFSGEGGSLLAGFAPGEPPHIWAPGTARLIKAGSTLVFQVHYTPNGTAVKDRSYIGLKFASQPPAYRAMTGRALNAAFKIPPGDPNYEVKSSWIAKQDIALIGLMPHMHLRGKDFKYTVVYPDGREETILSVPKYDFNWQLAYDLKQPLQLPKGTRIDCVAHFDNSPNNKYNPDPTKEVKWGDQTWEEMMIGWFTYTVPVTDTVARASN
jgi:mono/diheme cytochrome c family protein